jgi:hypothetical protein
VSIARMTQVGPTAPSGLLPSNRQAWQSSKLLCSVQRPSLNRDLLGLSATIFGAPRHSVILPVTQICLLL